MANWSKIIVRWSLALVELRDHLRAWIRNQKRGCSGEKHVVAPWNALPNDSTKDVATITDNRK
ncbi:hypothetical protein Syun_006644 [Stephania yunnanensis]|uniref:Uncharacterized protein n=1 Tax=Stephania yunnanensis TaxID=152371 RepID=A0AAP0KX02_9MAGN